MQRFVIGILLLLMLLSSKSLAAETTTYGAVVNGMSCSQISTGSLECNYKIGKDLVINIAGIGDNDAGVTIFKSNGLDGDYYPTFGILHGCIIVKPGKKAGRIFDYAFISPKTGKVYNTWQECGAVR